MHNGTENTKTNKRTDIYPGEDDPQKTEIAIEKAKLDQQFANGKLSGKEYNQKIIELMVPEEHSVKPPIFHQTRALIILIIVIVISIIPAAIYLNWRFYFQNDLITVKTPEYIKKPFSSINAKPTQTNIEKYSEKGNYKGRPIEITYKAYYDITGVVVSVRDYWGFSAYDSLVPRDVCLIWGNTVTSYNKHDIEFSQGKRNCKPKINGTEIDDLELSQVKGSLGNTLYALNEFSNNHIISSTPEIRNKIFNLRIGDQVRMTGYLVDVRYDNIILSSSTSREDYGDNACEVFYVTEVENNN